MDGIFFSVVLMEFKLFVFLIERKIVFSLLLSFYWHRITPHHTRHTTTQRHSTPHHTTPQHLVVDDDVNGSVGGVERQVAEGKCLVHDALA